MKKNLWMFLIAFQAFTGLQGQNLQIQKTDGTVITVFLNAIDSITFLDAGSLVPTAAFTADPTTGALPLIVNFSDLSTNEPTGWYWDFGDGNSSTQQNPVHTYYTTGSFSVQLTVSNNYGSGTEVKSNYITVSMIGGGQPCPGMPTVADIDGNVYNTVLIGNQCWMKENLKTTHYVNGSPIEYPGDDDNAWFNNTSGAYAWYDNDISWKNIYGALYNWHAATNGICPEGWHLPSDAEWTQLTDYVVMQGYPNNNVSTGAGNALKSCRQINSPLGGNCNTSEHPRWNSHGTNNGFDEFGFSALPGGNRSLDGEYSNLGLIGSWWTSTQSSSSSSWARGLDYLMGDIGRGSGTRRPGFSIRCLKD